MKARDEILDLQPGARFCGAVIEDVLADVEMPGHFPMRAGQSGEAYHQVERLGWLVEGLQFLDQAADEIAGARGGLAKQCQSGDVLRAVFRFGQEKCEVERGKASHEKNRNERHASADRD